MTRKQKYWTYALLIFGQYGAALFLPAMYDPEFTGFECLTLGWITPPWYTNIALAIGCYLFFISKKAWPAQWFSAIALGLALGTFFIIEAGPGYYLWTSSCFTLLMISKRESRLEAIEN